MCSEACVKAAKEGISLRKEKESSHSSSMFHSASFCGQLMSFRETDDNRPHSSWSFHLRPHLFLYVGFWIDKGSFLRSLTPSWPYRTFPSVAYCSLRCPECVRLDLYSYFKVMFCLSVLPEQLKLMNENSYRCRKRSSVSDLQNLCALNLLLLQKRLHYFIKFSLVMNSISR